MKKSILIITVLLLNVHLYSQEIDTNYYPTKKAHISNNDYKVGVEDLTYAYVDINENSDRELNYIDYWRIASAYARLGEDKDTVYELLLKSKKSSKENFCIILNYQLDVNSGDIKNRILYKVLGEKYTSLLSECSGIKLKSTYKFQKKDTQFPSLKHYSKSKKTQWGYFKNTPSGFPSKKRYTFWTSPCKLEGFLEKKKDSL